MNPLNYILLLFSFIGVFCNAQDLVILHTNDLHSRLNGSSPESEYSPLTTNDDPTKGGFSRIASVIKHEKHEHENKLLTLDAGDFSVGTLFYNLERESGFQLSLMGDMGYDLVALGNHEFDFGTEVLAQIISKSAENGTIPQLILSNAEFNKSYSSHNSINKLYSDSVILPYTILVKNGIKIGVFSIIGKKASESVNNNHLINFRHPIRTARRMVRLLNKKDVDFIIALSHSGISKNSLGNWVGEDINLAENVNGIDLIISGHSHTVLHEPIIKNNTYIVQAGEYGSTMGKVEINFDSEPNISTSIITIDDRILGDPLVQSKIDKQAQCIKTDILEPLGLNYSQSIFETDFPLMINRGNRIESGNLGPFIADAILNEAKVLSQGHTHISLIPAGMIRGNILPGYKGLQTTADLFNTLSLGNGNDSVPGYPLSQIYVNSGELKKIVEVLLLAYQSGASKYVYYSGLRVSYNPKKFLLQQVQTLEIMNKKGEYTEIDESDDNKLYGLVGNSYLLNFLFLVKEMSLGVINVTPKHLNGTPMKNISEAVLDFDPIKQGIQERKEWITLINYSKSFQDIDNNGIPNVPITYKDKVNQVYIFNKIPIEQTIVEK